MRKLFLMLPLLWGCNDAWPEFREECKEFCTLWDMRYSTSHTNNADGTIHCVCHIPNE